ncbi:SURF1-domain-containing protein [Westerdykella ornata]|uniref:SURF1-like protein n=1 Tax=Westerdykella ornata TaxID=318751 RepID=A0A6A6JIK8_WESOR|nr:SURF1-domain-containing protein [Westerdykella ornata]KAF2275933.1 SURF1-domain-containing protein [Westerdykella ornata]
MSRPNPFLNLFRRYYTRQTSSLSNPSPPTRPQCLRERLHLRLSQHQQRILPLHIRRHASNKTGDNGLDPNFVSILDAPAKMARVGKQHHRGGLLFLAIIPITAFALGCWQVQRLGWKTDLIARFEDRLTFPPLELPVRIDPDAIEDFDYRKVWAKGVLRHDQEMLVGPRMMEGENGYIVVTPLERTDERGNKSKILCCRGWIKADTKAQWFRTASGALPEGEVVIEGLLRVPPKRNMFTPVNRPEKGEWFFPDVGEMARWTGSQEVWVEETMTPDLLVNYEREPKGIPIGRPPTVNLKNNHTQYIFTWYALSLATSVMFYMVVKKPISGIQARVRRSHEWS